MISLHGRSPNRLFDPHQAEVVTVAFEDRAEEARRQERLDQALDRFGESAIRDFESADARFEANRAQEAEKLAHQEEEVKLGKNEF